MATHIIELEDGTVHGRFARDIPPVLTIDSGDIVRYRTLDAGWGLIEQADPYTKPQKFAPRDRNLDPGHALCGPIAINTAQAGATLEVRLNTISPAAWGWSSAGGYPSAINDRLGVSDTPECIFRWSLNADTNIATNQFGHSIAMRPFMGILGMPPDEPGTHSTFPPRYCGGNLDCKELVESSRLYLPIPIDTGLFSIGDGHAIQGDGEVAGPALECPMQLLEVEFHLHPNLRLTMPRAWTPSGWITFGLHEDLNEAMFLALEGILDLMEEEFQLARTEALAIASLVADLRVTQIVNGVRGVHAIFPHSALEKRK